MTYQKPINPQRFDKRIYEKMEPKRKVEKKRITKPIAPPATEIRSASKKAVGAKASTRSNVRRKSA